MDKISVQKAFYLNLNELDWNLDLSNECWTGIFSPARIAAILNKAVERAVNTPERSRSIAEVKEQILHGGFHAYAEFGTLKPECLAVLDRVINYIYSQEDDWK